MEGPRGPDLVPTAPNWSDWVGVMVTTHFGLVLGLIWAPRGPKRARFGPKRPFWGSQTDSKGPGGPDLVPTAVNWSDWVGIMVTKHFDLASGLFRAPRASKRALLGPKRALIGLKLKIVANLSCDLSKFAQKDHLTNGENIFKIWFTS